MINVMAGLLESSRLDCPKARAATSTVNDDQRTMAVADGSPSDTISAGCAPESFRLDASQPSHAPAQQIT